MIMRVFATTAHGVDKKTYTIEDCARSWSTLRGWGEWWGRKELITIFKFQRASMWKKY